MILVINKSRKDARSLAEILYIMGVIAYPATPSEALSEISLSYSAVIVMNPEILPDKEDYVTRLRKYASIPIFAYSDTENNRYVFDGIISSASYVNTILSTISGHCEEFSLKAPGIYKLAGIDASAALGTPISFDKPISLTKTEAMILRTLIVAYPTSMSAKQILKYAFRQNKTPEASNIRTHISAINRKFREIAERNLISANTGDGYLILTPEVIANQKTLITK